MTFDEDIKKENLSVLFKFNDEAVCLLFNKVKVLSAYLNQMKGHALLFNSQFFSKEHIKILARPGPKDSIKVVSLCTF